MKNRKLEDVIPLFSEMNHSKLMSIWSSIRPTFYQKIIVLDDDPTGVQTVHGISVYTDWTENTIQQGFMEESDMFFILTNSRAFTAEETTQVHRDIAERVEKASKKFQRPYVLISRGDSTLRGHYPLETEILRQTVHKNSGMDMDGEIILPFFKEGGRFTIENMHFVLQNDQLVPAGETEFAKDRTFGYHASHLGEWVEEKTNGNYKQENVTYISLESIRRLDVNGITEQLMRVSDFNKVVVNALDERDVTLFTAALIQALNKGKRFLYRTAATFTKVIGNVSSRALLTKEELVDNDTKSGGLIIVGSHVQKTTDQLNALKELTSLHFIELNSNLVLEKEAFNKEIERVRTEAEKKIANGITTAIYTKRQRLDLGEGMEEEELKLSVSISEAVTSIVRDFSIRPKYVLAKGGITSSDVGTKGLCVKRATVAGQISPGIPVWKTGGDSTFPGIAYIIFPGNVGDVTTLKEIVSNLDGI